MAQNKNLETFIKRLSNSPKNEYDGNSFVLELANTELTENVQRIESLNEGDTLRLNLVRVDEKNVCQICDAEDQEIGVLAAYAEMITNLVTDKIIKIVSIVASNVIPVSKRKKGSKKAIVSVKITFDEYIDEELTQAVKQEATEIEAEEVQPEVIYTETVDEEAVQPEVIVTEAEQFEAVEAEETLETTYSYEMNAPETEASDAYEIAVQDQQLVESAPFIAEATEMETVDNVVEEPVSNITIGSGYVTGDLQSGPVSVVEPIGASTAMSGERYVEEVVLDSTFMSDKAAFGTTYYSSQVVLDSNIAPIEEPVIAEETAEKAIEEVAEENDFVYFEETAEELGFVTVEDVFDESENVIAEATVEEPEFQFMEEFASEPEVVELEEIEEITEVAELSETVEEQLMGLDDNEEMSYGDEETLRELLKLEPDEEEVSSDAVNNTHVVDDLLRVQVPVNGSGQQTQDDFMLPQSSVESVYVEPEVVYGSSVYRVTMSNIRSEIKQIIDEGVRDANQYLNEGRVESTPINKALTRALNVLKLHKWNEDELIGSLLEGFLNQLDVMYMYIENVNNNAIEIVNGMVYLENGANNPVFVQKYNQVNTMIQANDSNILKMSEAVDKVWNAIPKSQKMESVIERCMKIADKLMVVARQVITVADIFETNQGTFRYVAEGLVSDSYYKWQSAYEYLPFVKEKKHAYYVNELQELMRGFERMKAYYGTMKEEKENMLSTIIDERADYEAQMTGLGIFAFNTKKFCKERLMQLEKEEKHAREELRNIEQEYSKQVDEMTTKIENCKGKVAWYAT